MIAVAGGLANIAAVLLIAPLCEGVLRKVTARLQSRRGPPLWQPYFDLLKLLGKEDIESGESPGMQRFVARLSLAAVLTVACLVPMGFPAPMNGAGDVILLIYLLTLCGICTLLGGLAAGSTYSLLGIGREMMTMIAWNRCSPSPFSSARFMRAPSGWTTCSTAPFTPSTAFRGRA